MIHTPKGLKTARKRSGVCVVDLRHRLSELGFICAEALDSVEHLSKQLRAKRSVKGAKRLWLVYTEFKDERGALFTSVFECWPVMAENSETAKELAARKAKVKVCQLGAISASLIQ